MKKPIIGIIGKVQPQYGEDIWHRIDEEKNELYRQIDICDGFILQGGLYSSNYEIEMASRINVRR